jgi:hypothetical protein
VAHPAAAAVDQRGLCRPDRTGRDQALPGRHSHQRQGGTLPGRQSGGPLREPVGGYGDVLRAGPRQVVAHPGREHGIADRVLLDAGTHFGDRPGGVTARDPGQGRARRAAVSEVRVDGVDRRGLHAN